MKIQLIEVEPIPAPTIEMKLPETYVVVAPTVGGIGSDPYVFSTSHSFSVTPHRDSEASLKEALEVAAKKPGAVVFHYPGAK